MGARDLLQVDPIGFHLPGSRQEGVDLLKLNRQIAKYGKSTEQMPPIEVSRGSDGELVINDGVTRATRIAKLSPGTLVTVEVFARLRGPVGNL